MDVEEATPTFGGLHIGQQLPASGLDGTERVAKGVGLALLDDVAQMFSYLSDRFDASVSYFYFVRIM
jgi:hypothetical protein